MQLPIDLPIGYKATVSTSATVNAGDIIANKTQLTNDKAFNICKEINVSPKKALKYLRKNLGDSIEKGDIIAIKKSFLRLGRKVARTPFTGTITKFEEDTGNLIIRANVKLELAESIKTPISGVVEKIEEDRIIIAADKEIVTAKIATGGNCSGKLMEVSVEILDSDNLPENIKDKILIGKKITKSAIFKAFAIGARGLIFLDISEDDLEELERAKTNNAFAIISEEDYEKTLKNSGKDVYLDSGSKSIVLL
ncbi:hypothetical protein KKG52_02350 [Patescibacteria group bacterium]|nr:hypothetical protein [Patescibacteria group bacterium]